MNTDVLFVRVMGILVPISEVALVQVNPNQPKKIVHDIPLTRPIEDLMNHNLHSFVNISDNRKEWMQNLEEQQPPILEKVTHG